MTPEPSRWHRAPTWHALIIGALQIVGPTVVGWPALSLWRVFLWDDLCLAGSSWVRIGWARTEGNEDSAERSIAIACHAFLDRVTISALLAALLVMMPWWPDGESFGSAVERDFRWREFGAVAAMTLCLRLTQWPAWRRADRSGDLPDIDAIRDGSQLLTRFWVANLA